MIKGTNILLKNSLLSLNFSVFLLFFFSGAFSLVYEIAWTRALTLEFGSTTLAISTVLTIFMSGLAYGAHLAGKKSDQLSRPLLFYGIIEVSIALYSLLTPLMFRWFIPVFSIMGNKFADSIWLISLWRLIFSVIILLPPTILMGATLPVLSRFYALRTSDRGKSVGLLYGINTVGAFTGALIAGLALLPGIGLNFTIICISICNVALGLVACWISKSAEKPHQNLYEIPKEKPGKFQQSDVFMLVAIALTGFAAMACEVVWTRVLILVLGASVYAYTMVISIFLAGLGMGSWSTATLLGKLTANSRRVFFVLALLSALLVSLSSTAFRYLPNLFVKIYWLFNLRENTGNILWTQLIICSAVMFLPAFIMGGLFPAAARVIVGKSCKSGYYTGKLYASNTIGSIFGSFAAGFILIPLVGIRKSIIIAATVQVIGAITSIISTSNKRTNLFATITGGFVIMIILIITPPWHKQLMASGMYHYARSCSGLSTDDLSARLKSREEILFYRDGLTSTVTVSKMLVSKNKSLYISTNGKIDGSSHNDMPTQRLASHLPLLFHPDPEKICIIGMGTGCTAGSASLYPKSHVTVVEIEEAMVEGARLFRDHNYSVHENPKVDINITDGRLFLNLNRKSFDVIISEPSNHWLAGTSDLFTQEFYKIGSRSLLEEGIFCQWIQLYSMSVENLKTMIRTFASVFPHSYLASTIIDTDILLIGSSHPIEIDPKRIKKRMAIKEIKLDLADPRVKINSVFELLARIRMGPDEIQKLAGAGPLHTDNLPIIAYKAPMDLYKYTRKDNMDLISKYARGIAPYLLETLNPADGNHDFYGNLAAAYRNFLRKGRESEICKQLSGTSHE